jgi:3-hydroxy-9,10-secoandrosta-1,3,5(10)-triene-9,17-dione monooxygenase reductase component
VSAATPPRPPAEMTGSEPPVSSSVYRRVLGSFATGVVAVTGLDRESGRATGLAANSFCSVSLDPPLVAFCIAHASSSWPMIRERGGFCINVLAHDQEFVSARLAAKGPGKLEGLPWRPSPNGSPILGGAIAWIDARLESEHPAGDHLVVISRVLDLAGSDAHPLIFFRGKYRKLAG